MASPAGVSLLPAEQADLVEHVQRVVVAHVSPKGQAVGARLPVMARQGLPDIPHGIVRFQRIQSLTRRQVFDRHAGDTANGDRRAAASIAILYGLGQNIRGLYNQVNAAVTTANSGITTAS